MALIKKKELRKMSEKDMTKNINEFKLELAKEKANVAIGATVISPGRIREMKRSIARIETIKKERVTRK